MVGEGIVAPEPVVNWSQWHITSVRQFSVAHNQCSAVLSSTEPVFGSSQWHRTSVRLFSVAQNQRSAVLSGTEPAFGSSQWHRTSVRLFSVAYHSEGGKHCSFLRRRIPRVCTCTEN